MIPVVPLIHLNDLPPLIDDSPWHLITEPTVWNFHKEAIEKIMGPCDPIIVATGDDCKTLSCVEDVLGKLIDRGLNRQHRIIAFGGGAICDFAAFVASVAMRGIEHVLIPSTLLAQVDAAHGGKTAVNLPQGKNLCGAFKWAKAIVIEDFFLDTLPECELRNGRAEVYKTALIAGKELLNDVLNSTGLNTTLLRKIASIKNDIVQKDPFEKNIRAYLNLGHTAGHAIEAQKQHNHGECVGMGIRYALRLGSLRGYLKDTTLINTTDKWLSDNSLPLDPLNFSREQFFIYMKADKKQEKKGLKWIFVEKAGEIITDNKVSREDHETVLDQLNW